jgi:hypothetical protein
MEYLPSILLAAAGFAFLAYGLIVLPKRTDDAE